MPIVAEPNLRTAVKSIAKYGDTDVFPFPLENLWFHDEENVIVTLLQKIDSDFDSWLARYPALFVKCLSSVGHTGFRAATQIDPIWNAYLLGLVLQIAPEIEAARLPISKNAIFSYRFNPSDEKPILFNPNWN